MQIVPVLDIMKGEIVHAYQGQRQRYQALQSQLSVDNSWRNIVNGFLSLAPFQDLYIADLDAISGTGDNQELILQIRDCYPNIQIWLDAGLMTINYQQERGIRAILGSEVYDDLATIEQAVKKDPQTILSLDFNGKEFKGNPALLEARELWPRDIILMQLKHVGADLGPDWSLIGELPKHKQRYFIAGGVRHYKDLITIKHEGYAGCLIASALHHKRVSKDQLKTFFQA